MTGVPPPRRAGNAAALAVGAAVALAGGPAAQAQPAPRPMPAPDFVQAAAASDAYEIDAARVALIQSQDPRVRAFAEQMIADHTQTGRALRQATKASGLAPPPPGLSDSGAKLLSALQSLSGPAFDKAYLRQQVLAHTQALDVEQAYAADGADPNLRRAAQSAVPIIRRHLDMAERLRS